jgi:hypothetical protein
MFDSLDDQIKQDDKASTTPKERFLVWFSVAVLSVVIFGGLYLGMQFME